MLTNNVVSFEQLGPGKKTSLFKMDGWLSFQRKVLVYVSEIKLFYMEKLKFSVSFLLN